MRSSVKNFCTPSCAQKAAAALTSKQSNSDIQKVLTTLPRSSKSENDLLNRKSTEKVDTKKICKREGCGKDGGFETNPDYCSSNCSVEVKTEEKVKAAGYRPLVNEGGSSTTSEGNANFLEAYITLLLV